MTCSIIQSDALDFLRAQPEGSIDLVFASPPYCDARTYGIDAVRGCQEWVDWMLDITEAAVHACKGIVLWVCAGVQREGCYWPAPEGLAWEWWKRGNNHLWRPCIWWKVNDAEGGTGIPGSGGKQWLRNDWEYVLAFKREGWLPWADPLVFGHKPIYDRLGGEMRNRTVDGQRSNARVGTNRRANGTYKKTMDVTAGHNENGETGRADGRPMPKVVNPGNVLPIVVKARVGGGHMGHTLCHANEAPYPERLAEFFILSFCPPGGLVCDCFSGSGTTAAVSVRHGRNFTGCDLRESMVDLSRRRVEQETPLGLFR